MVFGAALKEYYDDLKNAEINFEDVKPAADSVLINSSMSDRLDGPQSRLNSGSAGFYFA
ncbi:MAG: hypothetical protein IK093_18670 [Ruminiclostridium sp.]|nr:hypothetical protein [Ruminiclostridium sp.]